jgi:hypothetical protein|tara:strand:- start:248 stop:466 length:219 start_codon:yes stop_codon:yes gene_type:complete
MDWIDEFLADEEATLHQISIIESLLQTSSSAINYENIDYNNLTYEQANNIIYDLQDNNNPTDPREQFNKIFK